MNLQRRLQQKFAEVLAARGVADAAPYLAMIKPAQDPRFGDYQANCAMSLGRILKRSPRDVAQELVQGLEGEDWLQPPEIAGPGFINLRFGNDWLAARLAEIAADERLGVECSQSTRTLVIDYSSPNVAKPMHVGHLRSTIIGDALARLYRFLGARVIADNHLGDWGTQFGILLYGYKHFRDEEALRADPVREMVRLYVDVRKAMEAAEQNEEDPRAAAQKFSAEEIDRSKRLTETVRQETAKLHAGDAENVQLWQLFMPWCREEIDRVYRRLDVHFDETLGESSYNPMLPGVVEDLLSRGIARESQGAVAIFLDDAEPPALIRKRDGAFTYSTTDLATIRYRIQHWHPDEMLYVVDSRQALHFKNLFEIAKRWGCEQIRLQHISFGSVLGPDRKPIKTREGGAIELGTLLDEAVHRAGEVYRTTRQQRMERGEDVPPLSDHELRQVVEAVGLGAVKYADLSQNRTSDYVFDWNKMLAMDGNTAAYMQYQYARVRNIFRLGEEDPEQWRLQPPSIILDQPPERALAVQLLRFGETLDAAAAEYLPSAITSYLWDLSKSFGTFYNSSQCRVLQAPTAELRRSRLALCDLTARTIKLGLHLLGIQTIERM